MLVEMSLDEVDHGLCRGARRGSDGRLSWLEEEEEERCWTKKEETVEMGFDEVESVRL